MPGLEAGSTAEPVREAVPDAEPVNEAVPDAEPVIEAAPDAEPVREAAPDAEPAREAAPDAEPVSEAQPAAEPARDAEPVTDDSKASELASACEAAPQTPTIGPPCSQGVTHSDDDVGADMQIVMVDMGAACQIVASTAKDQDLSASAIFAGIDVASITGGFAASATIATETMDCDSWQKQTWVCLQFAVCIYKFFGFMVVIFWFFGHPGTARICPDLGKTNKSKMRFFGKQKCERGAVCICWSRFIHLFLGLPRSGQIRAVPGWPKNQKFETNKSKTTKTQTTKPRPYHTMSGRSRHPHPLYIILKASPLPPARFGS
jgi:hypothetical protein